MTDAILAGLRVVVTGGGAGIGAEIARRYTAHGARVHVCDVAQENLDALRKDSGILGTRADVAQISEVDRVFDEVNRSLGGLDVLVNNAGITGPMGPIEDLPPAEWERIFAVNVHGAYHCLRRAVPMLKAAGGGLIINMSSVAGRLGYPLRTAYASTKWALVGLTQSLAMELGPHNIRVNAILPGWVAGERHDRNFIRRAPLLDLEPEELRRRTYARISLGHPVTTADIAEMAVFLASAGGRNITGQNLNVCAGVETLAV